MSIFSRVPVSRPNRSTFDLSYSHKTTMKMGDLVPVHVQEVLPGDHFKQSVQALIRLEALISPMMHEVDATIHYYFVPNRIIWGSFDRFIFAQSEATMPAAPYLDGVTYNPGSLGDYLGLPSDLPLDKVSALPFAAYQCIYNEYYRDQNLIEPINYFLYDGPNNDHLASLTTLRRRAWGHDYFTSCLPFAQKGEAVSIPIAGFNDVSVYGTTSGQAEFQLKNGAGTVGGKVAGSLTPGQVGQLEVEGNKAYFNPGGSLVANTAALDPTAATINDLRSAFRLQEWFEKNARGGTRMVEGLLVHFGVKSDDLRLDRPKYLGGSKQPVVISEVLQTSSSDNTTPQGNMAGHGISVGSGRQFEYTCSEHGWIIGVMSVLPKTGYSQGIPRHFSKFDRLDYAWPTFANLGEQEVLNREIYYTNDGMNDATFGYIPRYSEYKFNGNRVSADMKYSYSFWHMSRLFQSRPALNGNFVTADPTKRVFAVTTEESRPLIVQVLNLIKATRALPYYGVPTM